MGANSSIEWTDATWNPITGCTKVSPGCDHCYAERITERFHGPGSFEQVLLHPDRLDQPLRWRKPRRVFVNSMSDLFHEQIPTDYIARVFAVMASAQHHTFQILTKRHGRLRSLLTSDHFRDDVCSEFISLLRVGPATPRLSPTEAWPLPNVWLGVSVEDQHWADIRIPALLDTPTAVRFLSAEPLLGPIDLSGHLNGHCPEHDFPGGFCVQRRHPGVQHLDWVIAGGESGPNARPMHPNWVRSLRDQCQAAGVAFHFKQWGEWRWALEVDDCAAETALRRSDKSDPFENKACYIVGADGSFSRTQTPNLGDATMMRVGKKAAGRELDGHTWDETPAGSP